MIRDASGMLNAYTPSKSENGSAGDLIRRRQALLGPAYRLFYERPVEFVRGKGPWLFDASGQRYLDAYNNVASVGHCHPHVTEAISKQAAILNTHTRYLGSDILDYAERILATMPTVPGRVMFTCTGSEANDLALRVAKQTTAAKGIIVTQLAYHGVTQAVAEISPSLGFGGEKPAYVRTITAPDTYRLGKDCAQEFARQMREAVADLETNGFGVAAMVCDTIFSSDGVFSEGGLLNDAVEIVKAAGGLFIADEVQAGFGRTGEEMWGFQRHAVVPDIVTMGKPMGNGHPVAAAVIRSDLLDKFGSTTRYFNTFGGNTVSCAAGAATLDVIEQEGLIDNALAVGKYFRTNLSDLAGNHPSIGDVRGSGLFLGLELVADRAQKLPDPELAAAVVNGMRDKRILISTTGTFGNVLKIRPPLIWAREHADIFVDALDELLRKLNPFPSQELPG